MNAACSATLTFLFTDLCGSTASWEADPEAMRAALTRHDSLISAAVVSEGGRVFKTVGDGACAAFATAAAAIRAGIAIQDALAKEQWERVEPLLIRIAIHSGAAHLRDCDYFGPTVNRVARLLGIAHGGQTLVSHSTFELIRDDVPSQIELRDLGEHRLRDLARPEHVHEVVIPELNRTFPPLRSLDYVPNNLPHVQSRQDVSVESMQRTESYVAERENIRIAMKFALSDPATIDDAVALAAGVYDTWRSRVNHAEGLQWLKSALALEGWSHSDRRACALCRLLAGCSLVGDPAGLVYAEEGLHLCKHCKRAEEAVDICCFAALLAVSVGRTDECDKLLSEADQLTARGNTDDSMLLMTRGEIDRMRGKLQSARERNLEALKRLRRLGSQRGTAARINLAILDTQLGNLDQARRWSYDALDIAVARWHFGHLSGVFDAIALRAMSLNRSRDAAHLMGQAEQLRRDHCTPIPLADREFVEELRARICEALGDGAQQAFETGSRLPLEDAIALSRSI